MLKIKSLAVGETFEFQLSGPNDIPLLHEDGSPVLCVVHGPGSKRYARASSRKQARLLALMQRGQSITDTTAEEQQKNHVEFLCDITERLDVEYEGPDGQPLEGRAKLAAVFSDITIGFVAEQVNRKSSDWANFSRGSAKS